jgi:hypothetical protein
MREKKGEEDRGRDQKGQPRLSLMFRLFRPLMTAPNGILDVFAANASPLPNSRLRLASMEKVQERHREERSEDYRGKVPIRCHVKCGPDDDAPKKGMPRDAQHAFDDSRLRRRPLPDRCRIGHQATLNAQKKRNGDNGNPEIPYTRRS